MPARKPARLDAKIKTLQQIDEDKLPIMLKTIEGFVQSRNTLTESEFAHFAPLFKRDPEHSLDEKTHCNLEIELSRRTSPFDPIRIVADKCDENGGHEVVLVLPPRANALRPLNTQEVNTATIVDTFANKTREPNPLTLDAERATDAIMQLTSKTIVDKNIRERNTKILAEAEQQIRQRKQEESHMEDDGIDLFDSETIESFDELSVGPDDDDDEDIEEFDESESLEDFSDEDD